MTINLIEATVSTFSEHQIARVLQHQGPIVREREKKRKKTGL